MYKFIGVAILSIFMLSSASFLHSQESKKEQDKQLQTSVKGPNFVDKNNDGVCDHRGDKNWKSSNKGQNFVDKNNDGICDNKDGKSCNHRHGKKGKGHHGKRCK